MYNVLANSVEYFRLLTIFSRNVIKFELFTAGEFIQAKQFLILTNRLNAPLNVLIHRKTVTVCALMVVIGEGSDSDCNLYVCLF